jgi:hypothetical protein
MLLELVEKSLEVSGYREKQRAWFKAPEPPSAPWTEHQNELRIAWRQSSDDQTTVRGMPYPPLFAFEDEPPNFRPPEFPEVLQLISAAGFFKFTRANAITLYQYTNKRESLALLYAAQLFHESKAGKAAALRDKTYFDSLKS